MLDVPSKKRKYLLHSLKLLTKSFSEILVRNAMKEALLVEELAAVLTLVAAEQRSEENHLADVADGRRNGLVEVGAVGGEDQRPPVVARVAAVQREPRHSVDQVLERAEDGLLLAAAVHHDVEVVGRASVEVDDPGRDDRALIIQMGRSIIHLINFAPDDGQKSSSSLIHRFIQCFCST